MSPPPGLSDSTSQCPWEFEETKRYPEKDRAHLTEFEKRYPPDRPGQELDSNARVFRMYQDRMKALDGEMTTAWNDAINLILIFAGLFSAVLTAFLIDLSRKLEPDHAEITSLSLFVIASISAGRNITLPALEDPREFKPNFADYTVNALWFISLTLALVVSMFAMLVKEWIHVFGSRMRQPIKNLRLWAYRHRTFSDGIDRWRLGAFVSALSFGLHLALWLFLVGLSIRTSALGFAIFIPVTVLASLAMLVHVVTIVAPLVDLACPTVQPYLIHGWNLIYHLLLTQKPVLWRVKRRLARLSRRIEYLVQGTVPFDEEHGIQEYQRGSSSREVEILSWMLIHLVEDDDVRIVLDSAAHLDVTDRDYLLKDPSIPLESLVVRRAERLHFQVTSHMDRDPAEIARVLRSILCFGALDRIPKQTLIDLTSVRTHEVGILASMCLMRNSSRTREFAEKICQALGHWIRLPDDRLATPMSDHTRLILCQVLAEAAETCSALVSIESCATLVAAFCRNYPDVPAWIDLVARLIDQADPDQAIGSWSSNVTQTFFQLLGHIQPEGDIWIKLASRLLEHASLDMVLRYWNSDIARSIFYHMDNYHRHRINATIQERESHRLLGLSLLSLASQTSDMLISGRFSHGTTRETMAQSMLNILEPHSPYYGHTTSVWRLALYFAFSKSNLGDRQHTSVSARISTDIPTVAAQASVSSKNIAPLMAKLSEILCAIGHVDECADDVAGMFEQLLGDGHCKSFVDSEIDNSHAFSIARHIFALPVARRSLKRFRSPDDLARQAAMEERTEFQPTLRVRKLLLAELPGDVVEAETFRRERNPHGWSSGMSPMLVGLFNHPRPDETVWIELVIPLLRLTNPDVVERSWSAGTAETFFYLFDCHSRGATRSHPNRGISLQDLASILLLSFSRVCDQLKNKTLIHDTVRDTIDQSMLNLLERRKARDGEYTSIWRLALNSAFPCSDPTGTLTAPRASGSAQSVTIDVGMIVQVGAISQHVTTLIKKTTELLCVLSQLEDYAGEVGDMFEQLLGGGCLMRFVDTDVDETCALDIVCYVLASGVALGKQDDGEQGQANAFLAGLPEELVQRATKEVERTRNKALNCARELESAHAAVDAKKMETAAQEDEDKT